MTNTARSAYASPFGVKTLIIIGAVVFFITLARLAPASMVLFFVDPEEHGVSYTALEGTLWRGRARGVSYQAVPLGDVDYRLHAFALLRLTAKADLTASGGTVRGEGAVAASLFGGTMRIRDAAVDIDVGRFASSGIFGGPIEGLANLTLKEAEFDRSGCTKISGQFWTDIMNAAAKRFQRAEFPMRGALACSRGDLLMAMSGTNVDGSADLDIRVRPDASYEISATARSNIENVGTALLYFGFEESNGAYTYGSTGVLKGPGS